MFKLISFLLLIGSAAHADVSVPRAKQYLWTTYDVAVLGGESVPHALGASMPAGSIITNMWVYINTKFTDSGTGSLAFQCAGTRDLMAYQDPTAFEVDRIVGRATTPTAFGESNYIPEDAQASQVNMSAGVGSVPSKCEVTAVVRGDAGFVPLSAGKATLIIEYFKLQ